MTAKRLTFSRRDTFSGRYPYQTRVKSDFTCTLCSRQFDYRAPLKRHYRKLHVSNTHFKCTDCGETFHDKYLCEIHVRAHGTGVTIEQNDDNAMSTDFELTDSNEELSNDEHPDTGPGVLHRDGSTVTDPLPDSSLRKHSQGPLEYLQRSAEESAGLNMNNKHAFAGRKSEILVDSNSAPWTRSRSSSVHSWASSTSSRVSLPLSVSSVASSTTSLGSSADIAQYSRLIEDITKALFCTKDLESIMAVALEDPDIGAARLQDRAGRLIQYLGKDLRAEVEDKTQLDTSKALKSRRVSSHAAQMILQHMQQTPSRPATEMSRETGSSDAIHGESSGDSSDSLEEDDEQELSTTEFQYIYDFLLHSKAYSIFQAKLLDFVHKPYEKRIWRAIGPSAFGEIGTLLQPVALKHVAHEISWVPLSVITLAQDETDTLTNRLKAAVETHIGPTWDWWPLSARQPPLFEDYHRIRWSSPCEL